LLKKFSALRLSSLNNFGQPGVATEHKFKTKIKNHHKVGRLSPDKMSTPLTPVAENPLMKPLEFKNKSKFRIKTPALPEERPASSNVTEDLYERKRNAMSKEKKYMNVPKLKDTFASNSKSKVAPIDINELVIKSPKSNV